MSIDTVITIVLAVIVIIRGLVWEERKEKLYIRIENLEKEVEKLKGKAGGSK